jgi:glycosyltransferase involved in cell wall biosynthesis
MAAARSVLYFSNSLVRGGAEEHVLTLLRGLDRTLFRPHLVCTPEVASALRPDLPRDVEVTPLRLRRPGHLGAALRLARLLRARRVDVLHSHLFYASLFASPVGRLCRVPLIVETPHVREHWRRGRLKGHFVVDRLAGRCVDRYIAVSEANARYLVGEKGLPARKVTVIHNGCDLGRFDPARRPPPGLRERLGFGPADPVLLVLGRLEPQKGQRVLLEALPAVRERFPRCRLVCAGEGALRGELEALAQSLGLDEAVRFVGFQADVGEWLALADLTVLPSFYEGLPLAAIESLAAGRAVVATAVDGTPEVVVDGRTGLTVPPGDAAALARALCRLLTDAEERLRLGRAGREWVTEHFDQRQQVVRTQDLYLAARVEIAPSPRPVPAAASLGASRPERARTERR